MPAFTSSQIHALNFSTAASASASLKQLNLKDEEFGDAIGEAFKKSAVSAQLLCEGVLTSGGDTAKARVQSKSIVDWAARSGLNERKMLVKAHQKSGRSAFLIHHMALLPAVARKQFVKDYFASGGELGAVLEWIRTAGRAIGIQQGTVTRHLAPAPRTRNRVKTTGQGKVKSTRRTRGPVEDLWNWVSDTASSAVNAVADALTGLVDAVLSAGKTLVDAVKTAASWAVSEIADLLDGLLDGGKRLADILSAAVTQGLATLEKWLKAVVEAGKSIAETLVWAASQAVATAKKVVEVLIAAGKSVADLLNSLVGKTAAVIRAIISALLATGRAVADILRAIAGKVEAFVREVVSALLALGRTVRQVLEAIASSAVAQAVLRALVQLGRSVVAILQAIATFARNSIELIVGALIEIGQTIASVLAALANQAQALVNAVLRALLDLGRAVREIIVAAVTLTRTLLRAILAGLRAAVRSIGQILTALVGLAVSIVRTVLEGLLALGVSLLDIIIGVCEDVVEASRRGFFEVLIALGKGMLVILQAAAAHSLSLLTLAFAVILEICGGHRPMTAEEIRSARSIFGFSIDLSRVKIAKASIPADVINYLNGNRAFTTMYVINFASWDNASSTEFRSTLIHELTHVWQAVQVGPVYMVEALCAQLGETLGGAPAYDYSAAQLRKSNGDFSQFSREQQALIIQDYWRLTNGLAVGSSLDSASDPITLDLLRPYARQVFTPAPRSIVSRAARPAKRTRAAIA